ncbi:cysteine desulfurase family protein [Lysinibacillus sp. 54212]|uniref:cysteine desulfurase family protein n=1 Tax=Lysinibacillus sp. 54212 TaxID=3119829 RepID=UPI002FCC4A35
MIYLDYAATTPMTARAIAAYSEAAQELAGNPSSLHDMGGRAAAAVTWARKVIAEELGVHEDGIIFTGSGTEGNLLGILSLAKGARGGKHIISCMAEHTSVHAALNTLEGEGYKVTRLPLTQEGIIDLASLEMAIRSDTTLISIQHANSEIGTVQPVKEIARIAKRFGVRIHVDCVQSFCKLDITDFSGEVDGITVSAHKVGGPKGCGAVYLNPRVRATPVFPGVTHEKGLRGGTLDTPSIVAMAVGVEEFKYNIDYQRQLRHDLLEGLDSSLFQVIEAPAENQLPNICGICMKGIEGQYVMLKLNEDGIYISTGSACDINSASGTKAILAMGKSLTEARQFFRISFGSETTHEEIATVNKALHRIATFVK